MEGVAEPPEEIKPTVSGSGAIAPGPEADTLRHPLHHHGDAEATPGLVDFAVNVQGDAPPAWLRARLAAALDDLARYPSAEHDRRAREAVAHRHGREPGEVLVLAGSAEGFALLPALRPRLPVVVHPGFTEPEAALRGAGLAVGHVLTVEADGHRLDPAAVPEEADLVVVGNPTNPTGVLHPAADLRALARPGRVLVVDEAFADAVAGEPESLAGERLPGLLVLRSLTKTWALAGLRAGYALGDPDLLARLAAPRPHWPVGTLGLEAVIACSEPAAVAEAERAAGELARHRRAQAAALAEVPGVEVLPGVAPYLLLRLPAGRGAQVRERLRQNGIAVRRGDTFPGLGPDHLRVAVREPARVALLVEALDAALVGVAA
ncbi:Rv2231c family pyridoxal phosphate-dependent protein CobC [Pseudonocardia sp. RS11V-5]|uniref:Rv2231c family pyridoxal phosphate-dependent protein CobC n=1 Tax=Pseudonocardia terrae TaxID=2905831 RepID=UPI001E49E046|nr:Rv2231c family pyridoxal phosphate-dependent protein CobC [Pseudonocardia terrae]MCE3555256.1 Rv2231c family pyridoxal phosphate-dependent protein CobC [Pseudonocardia terrae]